MNALDRRNFSLWVSAGPHAPVIDPLGVALLRGTFFVRGVAILCGRFSELQFVSINVTEADLLSHGFSETFIESISGDGVDLSKVTIEITETMLLVNDNETVRNVLNHLHSAGVRIALDDFGTGYSSLSHLRDFPIDKVKIDKSFVQAAVTDFQARAIVQALIAMAANMNIVVIAEGVETEDQRRLLQDLGCDLAQGFLFSPAIDVGGAAPCAPGDLSNRQNISAA